MRQSRGVEVLTTATDNVSTLSLENNRLSVTRMSEETDRKLTEQTQNFASQNPTIECYNLFLVCVESMVGQGLVSLLETLWCKHQVQ